MTNASLRDRVFFVTGGNSGVGAATVQALASQGAHVLFTGRRADQNTAVERSVKGTGRVIGVTADMTVEADVERALSLVDRELGGTLHGALNNAGGGRHLGPTSDLSLAGWNAELAANLTSKFLSLKHEVPRMKAGGAILNISSIAGAVGFPGAAAYSAAMQGVLGLTRAAAMEYVQQGVRINAMILGGVDTPLFRTTMGATDESAAYVQGLHPIGRMATPDEIARTIVFLLSDASSFITGAALTVDGGMTAQ